MASDDSSFRSHPCIHGHNTSPYSQRRSGFMKWFCKFFKGSNHGASNGRHPRVTLTGEESMFWRGPARPVDDQTGAEKEEMDCAFALSLAENAKNSNGYKGKKDIVPGYQGHEGKAAGYKGQGNFDEDLARAKQESMSTCLPPQQPIQVLPRGYRVCGGCKREIGYGHYLSCMGTFWHSQCFRCHACNQLIRETEFSLAGANPYHKPCYKELHHPKCDVCHQFIPTNRAGLIEYRAHPYWGQKYCTSHEQDNTPRCCSCERMESRIARYISLGDGRSLCLECLDSAVMDTGDCQSLYHSIRDFYEGMNMKIEQQIPMLLVERQALNDAREGEKAGHYHMPETRGLCLSEEQTVSSILKRPRIGGNRIQDMRTYPQKLTRRCEVTAILVLYGLPRLLTGSILAHELMHGWLRLEGFRNLRPEVEEGICQVLSHMWLESEVMPSSSSYSTASASSSSSSYWLPTSKKGGKSEIEKKLGAFFMHQIMNDTSTAYGEGFRVANAAVNKYGLRQTLDHVRYTGSLPI